MNSSQGNVLRTSESFVIINLVCSESTKTNVIYILSDSIKFVLMYCYRCRRDRNDAVVVVAVVVVVVVFPLLDTLN